MDIVITNNQAIQSVNLAEIMSEINEQNYSEELELQLCEEVLYNSEILD